MDMTDYFVMVKAIARLELAAQVLSPMKDSLPDETRENLKTAIRCITEVEEFLAEKIEGYEQATQAIGESDV